MSTPAAQCYEIEGRPCRPTPIAGDDPRLAPYRNLTDAQLRADERRGVRDRFMAESELVVRTLLGSAFGVESLLCNPTGLARLLAGATVVDADPEPVIPIFVVGQAVLEAVVGFDFHRGVLACGVRPAPREATALLRSASSLTILEDIHNHDNMGGLFRVVAALGGNSPAVLLSPSCVDPLYRKSLRTSIGHVLRVPYATLAPWPDALTVVADAGFDLFALTPETHAEDIGCVTVARRPAIVLGAEGPGLSAGAFAKANRRVRIPIAPGVDSLNVHVVGAIALHRLVAQNVT